jgi:ADP-ribose pyrophosphatase YjhB (NUDIX family)
MMKYPISNSVVMTSKQNPDMIVAVHRKEAPNLVCFPGGKLDPNENVLMGAAREAFEETGVLVDLEELQPVYVGVCEGPKDHWTTAYWIEIDENTVLESQEPQMRPLWMSKKDFMEKTSFPIFNGKVLEALKELQ